MGQYWTWQCSNGEEFTSFGFGGGLKYTEQLFRHGMHEALMLLMTDTSSLGHGGGDPKINNAPPTLRDLIRPIVGRWYGKKVMFVGDYSSIQKSHKEYTDITSEVVIAVITLLALDIINQVGFDTDEKITTIIDVLYTRMENVSKHKKWECNYEANTVIDAIRKSKTA